MAIYYEHPDWFRPLFAELDARGINYVKLNAACHSFDPSAARPDFSLWDQDIGRELNRSGNSREKISTLPLAQTMTTWEVRGPPSRPTRRIDQTPIMTFAQTAHFCPTHTAIAFNPAEADVTTVT